jgi:hypothetical protein
MLTRLLRIGLFAGALGAEPAAVSLKWNELGGAIADQNVIVVLRDGTRVKGMVISVEQAALAVSVSRKGQRAIARDQIRGLRLVRMRKRDRVLGTVLGSALGAAAGGGIAIASHPGLADGHNGGIAAGILVAAAAPVAGYYAGKSRDRQETHITIVPD